jgi:xanthine dehydrogenase YagT iron-sulfur-binding subunit
MPEHNDAFPTVSRRDFIKGLGTTAVSSAMASASAGVQELAAQLETVNKERVYGPEPVAFSLTINGKDVDVEVEPRVTLLDVLRHHLSYTGAKEGCGQASCGACTVLLDGKPVNACMNLAIEAQGQAITTVEGLATEGQLSPLQEAFIEEDGLMCGYCTSGFLTTLTALLRDRPQPTTEEIRTACSGHLCRCGTYPRVFKSVQRAAGMLTSSRTEVISWSHGEELA